MFCMVGVELLTPMMGGFILAATICSGLSVYAAFGHSPSAGYIMLAVNVTLFPTAIFLGFQFLRRSPIILQTQNPDGIQSASDSPPMAQLKGEIGKAITPLRPGGSAIINDVKYDVVSEGKYVEAGTVLRVLRVNGSTIVVEAVA